MTALSGKVALVTGASKGMGRHFVAALVGRGVRVACLARHSVELDSLAAEFGDSVFALPCDVSDPAEVAFSVAQTVDKWGKLDIVVNNAAIFEPFAFDKGSDEIIRNHVAVNLLGVSWVIREAIPHLRKTEGQIVSISSESVNMPFPMLALYAATKAAVEVLSEGLREELRSDGIRVGVLRSGSVSGGSGNVAWSEETSAAFFKKIVETGHASMAGAPASPESMAEALVAMLGLPQDVSVDLIEVRAAKEGMPEGAVAVVETFT